MNITYNRVPLEIDYSYESGDDSTGSPEKIIIEAVWFDDIDIIDIYVSHNLLEDLEHLALKQYKEIRADERAEFIMSHKNNVI